MTKILPGTGQLTTAFADLLPHHLDHLHASGISDEVIREREYKSIFSTKQLAEIGFSSVQQRTPGILIPIHGTDGSLAGYQYRPDNPRLKNSKAVKYETPAGGSIRVDVPPRCRPALADPSVRLWCTEGIKKGDALASHGLCAVDLIGVWGFIGKNPMGGTTLLADFDCIALKGREIVIVYDSDVSIKPQVRQAMYRFGEHLNRKGAKVNFILLPPEGKDKIGVDDYLMAHSEEELRALIQPLDAMSETKVNEVHVPGFILRDGTVGEMVIDSFTDERTFVLKTPSGSITKVKEYAAGNTLYKPMTDYLAGRTISFASEVRGYESIDRLLSEVRDFVNRYVELPANFLALTALYIILTWVFDQLPVVPYLRAIGDYGTGKTRFLDTVGAIAFRSIRAAGATTPSPIFRILDKYRGTLILDEADFRYSDAMAEITKILNVGYKPGNPVLRSEPANDKKWEPRSYDVFGPKILATRKRWADPALESRCLSWQTEGLTRSDIPLMLGRHFEAEASALRCKLLRFRLDYLPKLLSFNFEDAKPVINQEPRLQEILLPLKALARGDEMQEAILDLFIDGMQDEIQEDRRNSLESLVLEATISIRGEDGELSAKSISERLNKQDLVGVYLERDQQCISARRIAAVLGAMGIKTRKHTTSRRAIIHWDDKRMAVLCRRYGYHISQNNASDASPQVDILRKHPSGTAVHASDVSPHPNINGVESEVSEGCEALFPGMAAATGGEGFQDLAPKTGEVDTLAPRTCIDIPCPSTDPHAVALGMPTAKALETWRSAGSPQIRTEDGQITDLAKTLSHPDVLEAHLKAVRQWLDGVGVK